MLVAKTHKGSIFCLLEKRRIFSQIFIYPKNYIITIKRETIPPKNAFSKWTFSGATSLCLGAQYKASKKLTYMEAENHQPWRFQRQSTAARCGCWGRNCRGGVHHQNHWWLCYIVDDGFHENLLDHMFLRTLILSLPLRSRVLGLSFTQAMYLGSWRFQGLGFTGIIQDLKSPKGNPFKSRFPKGSCEFLFFLLKEHS